MKITAEVILASFFTVAIFNLWLGSNLISREDNDQAKGKDVRKTPRRFGTEKNKSNKGQGLNSTRPHFILHIGPPKTATTSIQCGLQKWSKELADEDSYYFVGKTCPGSGKRMENNETNIPGHYLMMGLNDASTTGRGYVALKARMDYHRLNGNNVIYSNEAFANHLKDQNSTWDCLRSMLHGWNVKVIIGYRHYFDWIRSFYYQTHKQNAKLDQKWPAQGRGRAHPSFLSFLDYHLQRKEDGDLSVDGGFANNAWGHHLTISTYNKFSPHFDDVRILNLHDQEDVVTDFVCELLPDAEKTCHRLRATVEDGENHSTKRPLQSFDAHRVAEAAFEKGYITTASPKEVVVAMLKEELEKNAMSIRSEFLVCPTPGLVARLLNASIEFEQEMLAINHEEQSTSEKEKARNVHKSMYLQRAAEGRFCEVDPILMLKEETWVDTVKKIGEEAAKKLKI